MTSVPFAAGTPVPGDWFHPPKGDRADRDAALVLFLLPHAGGGAAMFRDWLPLLPSDVAPRALTAPGREGRLAERPLQDWDALYGAVHDAVVAELDGGPYAVFGHCLGAHLAFRLTTRLTAEGLPAPVLLGVSGWSPRGFFRPTLADSTMPEAELLAHIRRLGSFPEEVQRDPAMLARVLPALRADLRVAATFADDGAKATCPLVSYGGDADPLMVEPDAMTHWADRTSRYLGHAWLPGGHFFPEEHADQIAPHFVRTLRTVHRP
ncbi:thioesterase II family protein [Streptomyces leeuwenhoekii]|uniref:Gramicidin S biosynthesis protein GrsT n=1 Tax=Streptomyces leeuwenhoekii TaxID=1437453 RepID=A0A0F7VLQ7_STRLW|nr:thioesterase domain-containing protein [Streptomyces leeuwenhoekii]CQR59825.1 Gramicidin S biosynthesis protein GrsT [Streptomyces leeuwenhoekii]